MNELFDIIYKMTHAHRTPFAWGITLAIATIIFHIFLGREASAMIAAILLSMIGAVYFGFAIIDGRRRAIVIEAVGALGFACAALLGVLVSAYFIVIAIAGHAFWDLFHHRHGPWAKTPKKYISFCAVYDVCLAFGLTVLWFPSMLA